MKTLRLNKMETEPIRKVLLSMSLPIMFSMIIQALYNVVDSIYISRFSETALSAVTLTAPVQTIMIAIASGTCVGINAFLSRTLGQKNKAKAHAIVQHGTLLMLLSYVVMLLGGIFLSKAFFLFQTTDADIIRYGVEYMSICTVLSVFLFGQHLLEKLLQIGGYSIYAMISQIVGAAVNIILDPILIFGLIGFPALEVKGAAIATVIGQAASCLLAYLFHQYFNNELKVTHRGFSFDMKIVKKIYSAGLPSMIIQTIASVSTFFINGIFLGFSTTAAALYGICARLQNLVFMPVYGLTNGMIAIMAYNYGALKKERVLQTQRFALLYMAIIVMAGTMIIQALPNQILNLFLVSDELRVLGLYALRVMSVSFIFDGICLVFQTSFQAVGRGVSSLISSLCRYLVILVPVAYLLALTNNINNVWWAYPISGVLTLLVTLMLWKDINTRNIEPLHRSNLSNNVTF